MYQKKGMKPRGVPEASMVVIKPVVVYGFCNPRAMDGEGLNISLGENSV